MRSTRTPPALPSVPFQLPASSAPLIASVQVGPFRFIRQALECSTTRDLDEHLPSNFWFGPPWRPSDVRFPLACFLVPRTSLLRCPWSPNLDPLYGHHRGGHRQSRGPYLVLPVSSRFSARARAVHSRRLPLGSTSFVRILYFSWCPWSGHLPQPLGRHRLVCIASHALASGHSH